MEIINGGVTAAKGFSAAHTAAGIKYENREDMAMIFSSVPCVTAGTYTTNIVKAAPVVWDKKMTDSGMPARCAVINAGIANACTGKEGMRICEESAVAAAGVLNIPAEHVLLASTGVIGMQIPLDKITEGIKALAGKLDESIEAGTGAAKAIMTTDTVKKEYACKFMIGDKEVTVGGMCKGSGMIHPNMATMLAFTTTDVNIDGKLLKKALSEIVSDTFNMVSVDRDTSTNDTYVVMANGLAGNEKIEKEDENYKKFYEALLYVSKSLAMNIASDGEGATKLFEMTVMGAESKKQAKVLAKSIISSNLVKAMLYGNDANSGRVLCAMGYSGEKFDPEKVDLYIEDEKRKLCIVKDGMYADYSEEEATDILKSKKVICTADIHMGSMSATAWGCDLTYDYVKINGDYRS
ncbi:MAG: bifunctional glutamate N-acetyltransferase/amino-acid acetyltransferase ArgJ [Lachnospiraceae bacterium]|nr:bifunctional glutamate N-acetyltransferase/amino-acid acetyltransferase ArgJ [Lachnospiraceae bacterium]